MSPTLALVFALVLAVVGGALLATALRRLRTTRRVGLDAFLGLALVGTGAALAHSAQQAVPAPLPPVSARPDAAARDTLTAGPGGPVMSRTYTDEMAPELTYRLLDGRTADLASLRGRVVLVNFWATWCGPCLTELPGLSRLQTKLGPLGLTVVTVSGEPPDTVRAFVAKTPLETTVATIDPEAVVEPYDEALEVLPTTFLIDRDGRLVRREVGGRTEAEFEAFLADVLAPTLAAR